MGDFPGYRLRLKLIFTSLKWAGLFVISLFSNAVLVYAANDVYSNLHLWQWLNNTDCQRDEWMKEGLPFVLRDLSPDQRMVLDDRISKSKVLAIPQFENGSAMNEVCSSRQGSDTVIREREFILKSNNLLSNNLLLK